MNIQKELDLKQRALKIHRWVRWLAVLSAPWYLILVYFEMGSRTSNVERVLMIVPPAVPYLLVLLLFWGTAREVFVKRHAQQGLLQVLLRFITAALAVSISRRPEDGLWLFFLGNGVLWLFGTQWSISQANKGRGLFVQEAERLGPDSIRTLKEKVEEGLAEQGLEMEAASPAMRTQKVEPLSDQDPDVELATKLVARNFYRALRWLALLAVPAHMFGVMNARRASVLETLFLMAIPAAMYAAALILIGRGNPHPFIQAHRRQAFLLLGLRALTAFLVTNGNYYYESLLLFFPINGLQWFFGPRWGMRQVEAGMGLFVTERDRLTDRTCTQLEKAIERGPLPEPDVPFEGAAAFGEAEAALSRGDRQRAVHLFTQAFRSGDTNTRSLAVRQLEALGEVEVF